MTGESAGEYSVIATPRAAMTSDTECTRAGSTAHPYSADIHPEVARANSAASGGDR